MKNILITYIFGIIIGVVAMIFICMNGHYQTTVRGGMIVVTDTRNGHIWVTYPEKANTPVGWIPN